MSAERTYPLVVAAERICGPDSGLADPVRWVARQIKRGRFGARRIGRSYRMTQGQIEAAIALCENRVAAVEPSSVEPVGDGFAASLTPAAQKRLRSVS